jgi:hypothetical protein
VVLSTCPFAGTLAAGPSKTGSVRRRRIPWQTPEQLGRTVLRIRRQGSSAASSQDRRHAAARFPCEACAPEGQHDLRDCAAALATASM